METETPKPAPEPQPEPPKPENPKVQVPKLNAEKINLPQLMGILNLCYSESLLPYFDSDGQLKPEATKQDMLAAAVITEVGAAFDPEAHHVDQVAEAWVVVMGLQDIMQATAERLRGLLVKWVVLDFVGWLHKSGRQHFSTALFRSWIDVHPSDRVREMQKPLTQCFEHVFSLNPGSMDDLHTSDFNLPTLIAKLWTQTFVDEEPSVVQPAAEAK